MKMLNYVSGKLIMVAIACSFAASTPIQAQHDDARWLSAGQPILGLSSTSSCTSTVSTSRIWGLIRVTRRCCPPGSMSYR